jgi:hypothetical protein
MPINEKIVRERVVFGSAFLRGLASATCERFKNIDSWDRDFLRKLAEAFEYIRDHGLARENFGASGEAGEAD